MENLKELYRETERRLTRVEFDRLWTGFHPFPFALYAEDDVCLGGEIIPRSSAFRGNTAIRYGKELVAIWNVGGEKPDLDLLAANLVHEMFHAFQMERGETRFPDDLEALDDPLDAENLSQKLAENKTLCRALREPGDRLARLAEFCALREARLAGTRREPLSETVEGMAEYMGLRALRRLSEEKYQQRVEDCLRRLEEPGPLLLDARRMSYFTGAALLLAAEAADVPFFHDLAEETRPVYELVRRHLPHAQAPAVPTDGRVRNLIEQQKRRRQERLSGFFRTAEAPVSGDFEIRGYDPMNMFRAGKLLYGSHFWRLHDRSGGQMLELGEAVLLSGGGRHVTKYWRAR